MKQIFFFFFLSCSVVSSQNTLSVVVEGVKSSDGKVSVAVYNQSDGFLKLDTAYMDNSANATEGETALVIDDLPDGEYALAVFHDENANNQLDTNWLGIPKEDVGFSNARMKTFGPPSFKECAIKLNSDAEVKVRIK